MKKFTHTYTDRDTHTDTQTHNHTHTCTHSHTHSHTITHTHSHGDTHTHTQKATKRLKTFWLLSSSSQIWPLFALGGKKADEKRECICWLVIFIIMLFQKIHLSFIFELKINLQKKYKKMFDQPTTCFLRKKKKKKELSLFSHLAYFRFFRHFTNLFWRFWRPELKL